MKRRIALVLQLSLIVLVSAACKQTETTTAVLIRQSAPSPRIHPYWLKSDNRIGKGDVFDSIRKTADGGFIVAGKARFQEDSLFNFKEDAGLWKLDAGGNIQWQYGFGKKYDFCEFLSARQTLDGGYLAMGKWNWRSLLVKLDAQGTVQWQQMLPAHFFLSFLQLSDGDFILTGSSIGEFNRSIVTARLTADGQSKWQKVYGPGEGRQILQTSDGGFIVLAALYPLSRPESLILKLDQAGVVQWEKHYRGSLNAAEQAADGGLLLAGTVGVNPTRVFGAPAYINDRLVPTGPRTDIQGWLLKLDRDGNEQWQKLYGGVFEDEFTSLRKTRDGKFVLFGVTDNYGAGNTDLWLVKINEDGSILRQNAIGGSLHEIAHDVEPLDDDGYAVAARTMSLGGEKPVLIKVDASGAVPDCTLPMFHPSNAAAEDAEENAIEPSPRSFTATGQDVSVAVEKTALSPDVLSVVPASFSPPEPGMLVYQKEIRLTAYAQNKNGTKYGGELVIRNIGAADLKISNISVAQEYFSAKSLLSIPGVIWDFIRRKNVTYDFPRTCTDVKPDSSCSNKYTVFIPKSADRRATVTITSNDPDRPVLVIPVIITAK